ncbi:MAG: 2-oxo acid dehydrogenase subunit E2 [Actinobacteria bacterium]|nr:2-oxo acid dehydrogenase subunit E2 [Actinomycetota bacterium]
MSEAKVFALPDLGEGLTEAEIVEWLVAEGDEVSTDQHVVTVETAKAAVEVPCPYAGTVTSLHGEPGQMLAVGSPLLTVGGEASGSGAVLIGYGTGADQVRRARAGRRRGARAGASEDPPPSTGDTAYPADRPEPRQPNGQTRAVRVISPLVRRLARDAGLDLAAIAVRRPDGVIRRDDVVRAAHSRHDEPASPDADQRIPLTGVRRTMAELLSTSRREIPDATTWVDVDATELLALRDTLHAARPDDGIGLLALLARITVAGLRRHPELNSSVDTDAQEIVQHGAVHLGFAAQSPRGLVVPVVRDAGSMTTVELAIALRELTDAAREGTLTPAQLTGGTFTLNNYGVFGVDGSTPIINHPEAAMLGVGRIIDRPWAHEGQIALRKITQLSFTFDHRVCDGGTAGGFLRFVADCVEQPAVLLGSI